MESQQPPQKTTTAIIQYDKTLLTTKQQQLRQKKLLLLKLQTDIEELKKQSKKLTKKHKEFKEEFLKLDEDLSVIEEFISSQETSNGIQAMTIMTIQESITEVTAEVTAEVKADTSNLTKQIKSCSSAIGRLEQEQSTADKYLTLAERNIKHLNNATIRLTTELANVVKQTKEVPELKKELLSLKEQHQNETIPNISKLQNIVAEQQQSTSTLRKWLMALGIGGGSIIALTTIWLWHYTHK